ncbi:MAG: hypothetical protein PHH16_01105 [Candidatus Gracilibacteria bacterium]|nr:hypothetical protein [Candidatus Gracilibacteria bacterium]
MQSYITHMKQISGNIILLYRNFLHWNISKICIFLYANIVGFIASLPFVGIIVYQYFTSYSKLGLSTSAEEFLLGNIGTIAITVLVFLCIVTIFICTYTYGNFLLQNVYKSYLMGEKLPYTKNLYFSGKHFRAYTGILGWISLYLLAPILIGIILIVPFGILAKTSLGLSTLVIGGISLMIFIALLVWFLYLAIRLIFSYYILLYSEEVTKAKVYIDESFRLTKKKVWKIIFLILPFLIVIGILASILQTGEEIFSGNRTYDALIGIQSKSGQDDHKLLEGFFNGNDDDRATFGDIEKAFPPTKDTINKDFFSASLSYIDTKSIDPDWWIFSSIFMIFSFLVFEGLASMAYLTTYRIITGKNNEDLGS